MGGLYEARVGQGHSGHGKAALPQVRAPSPCLPMRERDPRHKEVDMEDWAVQSHKADAAWKAWREAQREADEAWETWKLVSASARAKVEAARL